MLFTLYSKKREKLDVFGNKVREAYQDLKEESKKNISQNEELCRTEGREVYVIA